MRFDPPLRRGRLLKRYKRFLCDVQMDDGDALTASCPNTGSLMGLKAPGLAVWLSTSDSTTRKYAQTWELVELEPDGPETPPIAGPEPVFVGINTGVPNRLVEEAIVSGVVPELRGYGCLKREQKYGQNSRIDLLLFGDEDDALRFHVDSGRKGKPTPGVALDASAGGGATASPARDRRCFVEVKNVHLLRAPALAEFPDSVTARGAKHLGELADMVEAGHRAVMVFLIQRGDVERFAVAGDVDETYAQAFEQARARGVEAVAVACDVSPEGIQAARTVPILL